MKLRLLQIPNVSQRNRPERVGMWMEIGCLPNNREASSLPRLGSIVLDGTVKRFEIGLVGFDKVDSKDPRQKECLAKWLEVCNK